MTRGRFWARLDRLTAGVAVAGVAATVLVGVATARSQAVDATKAAAEPATEDSVQATPAPRSNGFGQSGGGGTVVPRSGGGRAHASSGGS